MSIKDEIRTVGLKDGKVIILDQTELPAREVYLEMKDREDLWRAIKELKVRGAPAIGVAAAYGIYADSLLFAGDAAESLKKRVRDCADYLMSARPTAVNLSWAAERMTAKIEADGWKTVSQGQELLLREAEAIRAEDEEACAAMGEYGLSLLSPGMGILTHCNAGALATAGIGTCLAPIYLGQERGYGFKVFADETRPLLQGARLTSWELTKAGVDVTLICDNMAASVMKNGWVSAVVTGCDRMAANGDGANKIGTLGLAVLAKRYGIPFYMFVPTSTIDLNTPCGRDIEVELRQGREISEMWYAKPQAPSGVATFNPAFDVTDSEYITAVVTEKGIVRPPYDINLRKIMEPQP